MTGASLDDVHKAGQTGWQARSMDRLRAAYSVGDMQLDLWALSRSGDSTPAEWLVERHPIRDHYTAVYEVQLWLAKPTVMLGIQVGVEIAEDDDEEER